MTRSGMQHIIEFTGMYTKPDFIYHGILPGGDEHKMLMGCPLRAEDLQGRGGCDRR